MITPEKMSELERNKVIEIYEKLNRDLTSMIIKKLQSKGDISSYTQAQIRQLAKQGGKEIFYATLDRFKGISREQRQALKEIFEEVQNEELKGYKDTYKARGKALIVDKSITGITSALYTKTYKELKNLTKTVAFSNQKTYTKALDELFMKVATGSQDYTSAMKSTINDLTNKGVELTSKGRNYKLENTVKMNLMTSLTQTANDISKEVGGQIGANCVVIGHSPYCRPSHRVIDGVKMSLDKFKQYEYLTEEPNCYHIVNYDWLEEFEGKKNKVANNGHLTNAEYEKKYNTRQKQNYYARQVRDKKQEVASINLTDKRTSATNEELAKAKKELRNAQTKYRTFCKENGIEVDYSLTWKASYNK